MSASSLCLDRMLCDWMSLSMLVMFLALGSSRAAEAALDDAYRFCGGPRRFGPWSW